MRRSSHLWRGGTRTSGRRVSGQALLGVVVRRSVDRDDEEQDTKADRRDSATAGLALGGEEDEAASADQQDATDEEGEKVHPMRMHQASVPTRTGRKRYNQKVRSDTLGGAVRRANKNLAERDLPLLPAKLTPHSLRRTFASLLYATGESPLVVMAEMGHTSPALALKVYAQTMGRSDDEQAQLAALMGGEKARKGTKADVVPIRQAKGRAA
jgi:hypothetical protein